MMQYHTEYSSIRVLNSRGEQPSLTLEYTGVLGVVLFLSWTFLTIIATSQNSYFLPEVFLIPTTYHSTRSSSAVVLVGNTGRYRIIVLSGKFGKVKFYFPESERVDIFTLKKQYHFFAKLGKKLSFFPDSFPNLGKKASISCTFLNPGKKAS